MADGLVHTSGHPRQGELRALYDWLRPKSVIPMHGEARHLEAHVAFARACGIGALSGVRNGAVVRLLPGEAEIVDEAPVGRIYRDGQCSFPVMKGASVTGARLAFVGSLVVSVAIAKAGELAADPQMVLAGIPKLDADGESFEHIAEKAAIGAMVSIPRPRRKSPELVGEAVRKSVRAAINAAWGKKPICNVLVSVV